MANLLLAVTVVVLLVSCVAGASVPASAYGFQYTHPDAGTVSQSYSGPSDSHVYQWGYQYPGQQHSEKKTIDGEVKGDYAFTDANGEVQRVNYEAAPGVGFNVGQQIAAVRSGVAPSVVPAQDINLDPVFAAANPQLAASVRSGELEPFILEDGQQGYRVSERFVAEAKGSVSQLANNLDVDLFAPRHDQQVRSHPGMPYVRQTESNRAILETAALPDGQIIFVVRTSPVY